MPTELDAPTDVEANVDVDAPAQDLGGQAAEVDPPVDNEPQYDTIDLSEFEGKYVQVGEEYVPVSELPNGYLRQSDYTRKTQSLAEQSKEMESAANLWKAYQSNPEWTLNYLAQQNGMTLAQAQQAVADSRQADEWGFDDDQGSDPLSQRLEALEARLQREDVEREFDRVISGLQAKYDDFDPQEVADAAVKMEIFDPQKLEFVYHAIAHQRAIRAQAEARTAAEQREAAEEARRAKAAQEQAASTHSGGGATGTEPIPTTPNRPLTPYEAAQKAYADMEAQGLV